MAESTRRILSPAAATARSSTGRFRLLDGENLDLIVAHQEDIAAALTIGARAFAQARQIRAECPQITLFEASFGFQCSAHSSDDEFPLEL